MSLISSFFEQNFILVYFFYGLAFFTMGLAILLESRRTSEFHLARALRPLGGFGIVHGLHEWFEMFELADAAGATNIPGWLLLPSIRMLHLVISFTLLVIFGVQLIYANRRSAGRGAYYSALAGGGLALLWLLAWQLTTAATGLSGADSQAVADVLSRYMLGIPGALLAAWAIFLEQREFNRRNMPQFGRALLWAAVALGLYGMPAQLFTPPSPLFPSNVLNSASFWDVVGIPIQFFRAVLAAAMALAFIRAMRVFELESRQRLAAAQAERSAAQEEALAVQRQARQTTEQLNAELQLAVRNLSVLHGLARDLSATLDADVMLQEVFPAFIRGEQRVGAGMVILKSGGGVPEVRVKTICHARPEDKDAMESAAQEMGRRVITRERPGYWNQETYRDISDSVDRPWPAEEDNARVIGIPLLRQEEVIGAMLVCVFPGLPPFSPAITRSSAPPRASSAPLCKTRRFTRRRSSASNCAPSCCDR